MPVLYAAATEQAAVAETLLHAIPASGGALLPSIYRRRIAVKLVTARPLRLASLMGTGLRRLKVEAREVTNTDADAYPDTVRWAEAAYDAGFDGLAWMSRRCNTDRAYVFFGNHTAPADFELSGDYGRMFSAGADLDWLIDFCAPLHIEVLTS